MWGQIPYLSALCRFGDFIPLSMPKYLLVFDKGESVRWLSHLDILRTFERAIRRAGLPIAFSAGFNPREKLSFVSALGTGITGSAELASMELTETCEAETICTNLNDVLPSGIRIRFSRELSEEEAKGFAKGMDRAEFLATCVSPIPLSSETVESAIASLLAQEETIIERERDGRTRKVDIRPLIHTLIHIAQSDTNNRFSLLMTLGQGEGAVARPSEVVALLTAFLEGVALRRVHRIRILDREGQPWLYEAPTLVTTP